MSQTPAAASASLCRVLVLISGNGSNLQALIDRSSKPDSQFQIIAVISNRPDVFGLQRATQAGIPNVTVDHQLFNSREEFDANLMLRIDEFTPDLVVLAGFMRILSPAFVQHYASRLINIHPSLLPAYKGTNTHQRVLDAGDTRHGVSVHFVTEELDGGPVVLHSVVPVHSFDNKETLAARVAIEEHKIYPEAVQWFAQGRLAVRQNKVLLDGTLLPEGGICFQDA
jgi:phosphoribosylglycinamide formyltransferase 1